MVQISLFPQGTRVRVRRGSLPIDSQMLGREGLVLRHDHIVPRQVVVQLDGEERLRTFTDEELEAVRTVQDAGDAGSPGPGMSPAGG
ncbi:MAG: hypothetical protein EA351_03705 [Gemmatimonadales bacterium]|nr:MAG: hypothetical protein EA351_03705 [Gemmatimonadales bacterium]